MTQTMPDKLLQLLAQHMQRHPGMMLQDIFKLIYQGVFGAEHLIKDVARAQLYLRVEWESVSPNLIEPLLEAVDVDGVVMRLNLRPGKAMGIELEQVWELVYQSAQIKRHHVADFLYLCQQVVELCRTGAVAFPVLEAEKLLQAMAHSHYAPIHHSASYREHNHPAYRVVQQSVLKNFAPDLLA